jgi:hypothetical protein
VRRLTILVLLVPLAAACGGSKSAGQTSTSTGNTSADFVTAGNSVCIASDKRIFKIGRLTRNPAEWAATAVAARTAISEMRAIKPPPPKAAAFKRMLQYGAALTLAIQEVHDALVKKNIDTAAAAQLAAGKLQDKVHQSAKDTGLTFCQQPLTNWPA